MRFNTYLAWRWPSRVETWWNKHCKYSCINAYTHDYKKTRRHV